MVPCIAYKSGYKYQLKRAYTLAIPIRPPQGIVTEYVSLDERGQLSLKAGYAWDGPSGPTIDTRDFMRGSLVHDALYQLMRERHLDRATYRAPADELLRDHCREDGMSRVRAWWVYQAVRRFADPAADPAADRPLTFAPRGCTA
ncbi:MAG: DUF1353 domain-containing protein [Gemmatimonadales bacterium]|nr:DUF1353 domain-containing protein [Gemmatimonadota bacterium]MCL4214626.1 DUF1353 domain-containing protein [Gemmatimonadales bacterium]